MKVILPKDIYMPDKEPLFFLAGPIKGGGDWQSECCKMLGNRLHDFCAAIPCRYPPEHHLYEYKVGKRGFDRQLNWERLYLQLAGNFGCIIFWLPAEKENDRRDDGFPYAMDTRGELGEWRGRMMLDRNLRVIIGGENGFPGLNVIRRNFSLALDYDFSMYSTLEETVEKAIAKIK